MIITYTDSNFIQLVTGGEVFLLNTDLSFADRVQSLKQNSFFNIPDAVCIANQSIGVEEISYAIEQIQKKAEGTIKTVFIVFDQMTLPAQNAFLKTLEDVHPDTCIFLYVSKHTTLLSTVVSRVVGIDLISEEPEPLSIFFTYRKLVGEKMAAKRIDMIKPIVKAYDDDVVSKQDIISWVSRLYRQADTEEAKSVLSESIVLLQQQSVLVKYVLEYMVSFI